MRVGRAAVAAARLVGVGALPARGEWKPAASVEWAVESAGLVVRGEVVRIGPADGEGSRDVTIRVAEVIKGARPAGGRVTVRLGWRQAVDGLVRAAWAAPSGRVEVVATLSAARVPGAGDAGARVTWGPLDRFQSVYTPGGVMTGACMAGYRVADYVDLLGAVREAARYAALRGGGVTGAALMYGPVGVEPALPPRPPAPPRPLVDALGRVRTGSGLRQIGQVMLDYNGSGLVVPVDARLETLAMDWMAQPEPWARIAGLDAARWVRRPAAERRVRELLTEDPFRLAEDGGAWATVAARWVRGSAVERRVWELLADESFDVEEAGAWVSDPGRRARRYYRVRGMAKRVLGGGPDGWPAEVVEEAPHALYAPVGWAPVAWAGGILVGVVVGCVVARRWSVGGRIAVILTVLAVLVAWGDWRSRRVGESFSYARGDGADWEVTLAEGRILVLRVADGAAGHGWLVRRMGTTSVHGQWTRGLRKAAEVRGVWPWVTWERGTMAGVANAAYAYRAWEVSPRPMIWALAVWPAVWGAGAVWRVVRRRRWRRAGRCGACGYDLRGTGGGRCPECGSGTGIADSASRGISPAR
jgi:hypothetical protein